MTVQIYFTTVFLLTGIFCLSAQTSSESYIVIDGDTTMLNIDNYTAGDIQWQTKNSLLDTWENIPGAMDAQLAVPSAFVPAEKIFRAILFNGPGGKNFLTDANGCFSDPSNVIDVELTGLTEADP